LQTLRKKKILRKTKGAASNDSSDTLDNDYTDRQTTRAVSKQFKQTLLPNKKTLLKDDPLKTFYEEENYIQKRLELKKDQNKSFKDVVKSIKRKKQDDYKEETPGRKRSEP
jgi:hypothetical protein